MEGRGSSAPVGCASLMAFEAMREKGSSYIEMKMARILAAGFGVCDYLCRRGMQLCGCRNMLHISPGGWHR